MSKKVYCSVGPVPKNHKLGTMKECAEKKQVRYYGIKKIDPKLLEAVKKGSVKAESRDKLMIQLARLGNKANKLKKDMAIEKDQRKKDKMKAELDKILVELKEVREKFQKADQKRRASQKGGSKKASKKATANASKKDSRKGSKKSSKKGSQKNSWGGAKKTSKHGSKKGSRKN